MASNLAKNLLYLTKRGKGDTGQPDVFVYECRYVGLDDVVLRTRPSVADRKRNLVIGEINEVATAFESYLETSSISVLTGGDRR